ncbi:MAG: putative nucleotide-diphospho-sugar transferase [Chthoniobacteraceae bacterium]
MKFFCCYTEGHRLLFEEYFRPSLPKEVELRSTLLPGPGAGDFLSAEFLECISRKVKLVITSLREHSGELLVWTDIDILFFRPVVAELEQLLAQSGKKILFQREGKRVAHVNTGFFVCRASEELAVFFERVLALLKSNPRINEQAAVNQLLEEGCGLDFGYLPFSYYARTHGWPPPEDLALYHANATPGKNGQRKKIRQFKEIAWVRRYGRPARAWSCVTKIPKRLIRVASEKLRPIPS